jgi:xanthine dehydrogenase iron-sulfur cluster and FAD-binding subunit A
MWQSYITVSNIQEALTILAEQKRKARIVAGGTDLLLEIERKVRTGIETLVDITHLSGLDKIVLDEENKIHLGALVTHNHCAASKLLQECAYPLARAAWEVGAPQIRNRGTVAGNLVTASPANDTIPPLLALGASLSLASCKGIRQVALDDFYQGVRKTVLQPDEMLVDISFKALQANQRGAFIKLGLRKAQAISLVNAVVILTFETPPERDARNLIITESAITLGAVAPVVIHAREAEAYLSGKSLTQETIAEAARLAEVAATPISDLRSSADYRSEMVRICVLRALRSIANGEERQDFPNQPVLLWSREQPKKDLGIKQKLVHDQTSPIITHINGKKYSFTGAHHKTLLRLIREDAGLIGTKEGCAEGECGACTVFLDGKAVMSCLVPAPSAHGAQIITIEGLAQGKQLHPLQQAFIEQGAVQCGYCTPGFIMSGAKLLEEKPQPSQDEIKQAITGNLCRCTGYYSIVRAIEQAAAQMEDRYV